MKLTSVCDKVVEKAKKTSDGPFVRGVICGVPVEEVIGIKCLQVRRGGERVDSLSVLLDFQERVFA